MIGLIKKLFAPAVVENTTLKEPEWWRQMTGPPTSSGVAVTPDTAMTLSAVYACVRILSETVASLPLKVYETTPDGGRTLAKHPLNSILGITPNNEQTAFELREFVMSNLALRGNGYSHKIIDGNGRVSQIIPLNSRYMNVDRTASDSLIFDYQEPGNSRVYTQGEIWRVAALSGNGVTGLSPISLAREGLGVSLATEAHAAKLFTNGAQVPGTLEFDHKLDADQIANLRKQFADNYSGTANAWKPLILESGMHYKSIGMNADDAQFLESRKFQITEIARWYRVPPHMLAELDKATFSNIEHQSIEFVVHTIRPWLVRLEQTMSRDLLSARERQRYFLSHSVEGLLRGDTKSRYEAYGSAIQDGWLNRNEVRKLENRNPEEGLDEFILPLNMGTATEREQQLSDGITNMLAEREIKALKLEAAKKGSDDFLAWLPGFYSRHQKAMAKALQQPEADFDKYVASRISGLTADPVQAMIDIDDMIKLDAEAHLP